LFIAPSVVRFSSSAVADVSEGLFRDDPHPGEATGEFDVGVVSAMEFPILVLLLLASASW
jgi:hypothetical protein